MKNTSKIHCVVGLSAILCVGIVSWPAASLAECSEYYSGCVSGGGIASCLSVGSGSVSCWFVVNGNTYNCGSGCDCTAASKAAVADCLGGGGGGDMCYFPCGSDCCDSADQCCNGQCLGSGQTCCGDGACGQGDICMDGKCYPEGTQDCADGTFCAGSTCCNGSCIETGKVCCGAGSCDAGQKCVDETCVDDDAVECGDGTVCPPGTACAGGKCCPEGFATFDPESGFCCGLGGPGHGLCECATGCNGWCCPGGTVCCTGGWCAPSADGCPQCSGDTPKMCTDHSCVPAGATCCGGGSYCLNSLTCMECDMGSGMCCGNKSNPAGYSPVVVDESGVSGVSSVDPSGNATSGTTPSESAIAPVSGTDPVDVGGSGGCMAGSWPSGLAATILLSCMACLVFARRRRFGQK